MRGIGLSGNDLSGWDFSGQDLTGANFAASTLTNANLAGAMVTGASFAEHIDGFTKEQLYSTASYQQRNLRGIGLSDNDLTGWDFSGQDLTGADFGVDADERQSSGAEFLARHRAASPRSSSIPRRATSRGICGALD